MCGCTRAQEVTHHTYPASGGRPSCTPRVVHGRWLDNTQTSPDLFFADVMHMRL